MIFGNFLWWKDFGNVPAMMGLTIDSIQTLVIGDIDEK